MSENYNIPKKMIEDVLEYKLKSFDIIVYLKLLELSNSNNIYKGKNKDILSELNVTARSLQRSFKNLSDTGYIDIKFVNRNRFILVKTFIKTDDDKEKKNENLINAREDKFRKEVYDEKYKSKYPKEMLDEFFEYWTELNKSKTKMRFERENTWDTSRRLNRWYRFSKYKTDNDNKTKMVY